MMTMPYICVRVETAVHLLGMGPSSVRSAKVGARHFSSGRDESKLLKRRVNAHLVFDWHILYLVNVTRDVRVLGTVCCRVGAPAGRVWIVSGKMDHVHNLGAEKADDRGHHGVQEQDVGDEGLDSEVGHVEKK